MLTSIGAAATVSVSPCEVETQSATLRSPIELQSATNKLNKRPLSLLLQLLLMTMTNVTCFSRFLNGEIEGHAE